MNKDIMIAVFGATGGLGNHFVHQALEAGYALRVLVRNKAKFRHIKHPKVETIVGDSTKRKDVASVVSGADVVVSCLGNVSKTVTIMDASFDNIVTAVSSQSKPPRCLMITSIGCGGTSWLIKGLLRFVLGRAGIDDYEKADRRIRESLATPFVLVRPAVMTNNPGSGSYTVFKNRGGIFPKSISRADVAKFLIDCVSDTRWDGGVVVSGQKNK